MKDSSQPPEDPYRRSFVRIGLQTAIGATVQYSALSISLNGWRMTESIHSCRTTAADVGLLHFEYLLCTYHEIEKAVDI